MITNKEYLAFDATSIRKRIEQRLSENSDYTDYIYPGSDLSIFIDIVAQSYQVLQLYLNQAGSEAIASDARLYENINRIVKFLDYHPNGYSSSVVDVSVSGVPQELNNSILPAYSTITLSNSDKQGNPITFSTVDYYYVYDDNTIKTSNLENKITLYNGKWTIYDTPMVAEGIPYETFLLKDLFSDSESKNYTAWPFIHAFVKRGENWMIFKPTTNALFINKESKRVYSSDEHIFELRLNEYKQAELKFGDGIYAQKLEKDDIVYIAYLKSNGPDGKIPSKAIHNKSFVTNITGFDDSVLKEILDIENPNIINAHDLGIPISIVATNSESSSDPMTEESVEQIREFAPKAFRAGGTIETAEDYDYFIRSNYYKDIIDLKIMNNWDYLKEFLRWLYVKGLELYNFGGHFLDNSLRYKYGYIYADSCDFNNVYCWIKMKSGFSVPKQEILKNVQMIKPLTSELVFLDPVIVDFVPCAYDNYYDIANWDPNNENYIEIELTSTTVESPQRIRNKVNNIIIDYFSEKNQKIGSLINIDKLHNDILTLEGVSRIRTIFNGDDNIISVNGLSFAKWSSNIMKGEDRKLVSGTTQLEKFMFPKLLESSLVDRIKVITESAYHGNEVEY